MTLFRWAKALEVIKDYVQRSDVTVDFIDGILGPVDRCFRVLLDTISRASKIYA